MPHPTFTAIDFETANHNRDSACSVALVRVENNEIVSSVSKLICPPYDFFQFTHIHGITHNDCIGEGHFGDVWNDVKEYLDGIEFLAAHNAPFDRSVLQACCSSCGIEMPDIPFKCTVQVARNAWGLRPTRLPDVCDFLGIPLQHHDALSDAKACAKILIEATK
ncbi:3'-5' exonuclease [bacterium]|jgi:DNA polymerase-3 subunit epsilon|nr:3'-5' exonuclease [bacterium]